MKKQTKPKTGKVKKVKAWAIVSNEEIGIRGMFYQPQITLLNKAMAHELRHNCVYVIGKGYKPEIVPCTITYNLPTK